MSGNSDVNGDFEIEGKPRVKGSESSVAEFRVITPNYFSTMGIALLRGRYFDPVSERAGTPFRIMINDALARKYFGDEDPVGKRIQVFDMELHEVVGVVASARQWGPTKEPSPEIYFSLTQVPWGNLALVLKVDGDPAALSDSVRGAIGEVSRDIAILKIATLERVIADGSGRTRFLWLVMGTFGLLALALAVVGVYGVTAYDASQRTREMGVRLSLGAPPASLVGLVMARGLKLVAAGAAVGLAAAVLMGRAMQGLLFGVSALDAPSLAGGVAILALAVLAAIAIPAVRTARTDPMTALRYE
jgi:putative ABC transport system permease protein